MRFPLGASAAGHGRQARPAVEGMRGIGRKRDTDIPSAVGAPGGREWPHPVRHRHDRPSGALTFRLTSRSMAGVALGSPAVAARVATLGGRQRGVSPRHPIERLAAIDADRPPVCGLDELRRHVRPPSPRAGLGVPWPLPTRHAPACPCSPRGCPPTALVPVTKRGDRRARSRGGRHQHRGRGSFARSSLVRLCVVVRTDRDG